MYRRTFLLASLVLFGLPVVPSSLADSTRLSAQEPVVVYVVRHAERAEDGTSDPVISLPGWDRSRLMAEMLADADLTHIHSTDYKRTRMTGRPTADATGLEIQLYNPRDLASFAEELKATPGRHLVLGHSNTTPGMVAALGGDPGGPIEEMEYDRLYIVTVAGDAVSTVLIRFGQPYAGH
jgi:phosphohistidine phosphatase SixA